MAEKLPSDKRLQSDAMNFATITRQNFSNFAHMLAQNNKPVTLSQPTITTTTQTNTGATSSTSTASATGTTTPSTTPKPNPPAVLPPATTTQPIPTSNQTPTPTVVSKKPEPIYAMPFNGPKVEKFDPSKVEGCKFVLLDQLIIETPKIYETVSGTFQWEICQDQMGRCEDFIKNDCAKKRVFLVASGGLGAQIVPKIHDLSQLYAVYIYCANVSSHMEWALKYSKVRMVCDNDVGYLVPQLALDVAQSNLEWAVELLKTGDKTKAKKKLDLALTNVKDHIKTLSHPDLTAEIQRRIEECK